MSRKCPHQSGSQTPRSDMPGTECAEGVYPDFIAAEVSPIGPRSAGQLNLGPRWLDHSADLPRPHLDWTRCPFCASRVVWLHVERSRGRHAVTKDGNAPSAARFRWRYVATTEENPASGAGSLESIPGSLSPDKGGRPTTAGSRSDLAAHCPHGRCRHRFSRLGVVDHAWPGMGGDPRRAGRTRHRVRLGRADAREGEAD